MGEVKRVVVSRESRPRAGSAEKLRGVSQRTSLPVAEYDRDRGLARVGRCNWFVPRVRSHGNCHVISVGASSSSVIASNVRSVVFSHARGRWTHAAPGPPTSALAPLAERATLSPNSPSPLSSFGSSLDPCWLQVDPERVKTHAAPSRPNQRGNVNGRSVGAPSEPEEKSMATTENGTATTGDEYAAIAELRRSSSASAPPSWPTLSPRWWSARGCSGRCRDAHEPPHADPGGAEQRLRRPPAIGRRSDRSAGSRGPRRVCSRAARGLDGARAPAGGSSAVRVRARLRPAAAQGRHRQHRSLELSRSTSQSVR